MFFFFILALFILPVAGLRATETVFEGGDHQLAVIYNDTALPGDGVFVRLAVTRKSGAGDAGATTGTLQFTSNKSNSAEVYGVESRKGKPARSPVYAEFLAGIPLTTNQKSGNNTLSITYVPFGAKATTPISVELPLTVGEKAFPTNTLRLDKGNTAIMNDVSPERKAQSERLNQVVLTRDKNGVHQTSPFGRPTTGTHITLIFGSRLVYAYSDGTNYTSEHFGTDFRATTGTPVYASARGKVVLAEDRIVQGKAVVIEHLPGLYSLYYHQSAFWVKVGDIVQEGQHIGNSGATGLATGPHIHWEMRLNALAVNPDYFRTDFAFTGQ
jgi:murein DD-endopeptidase MepM/ murein hydrolase activator NlpD